MDWMPWVRAGLIIAFQIVWIAYTIVKENRLFREYESYWDEVVTRPERAREVVRFKKLMRGDRSWLST